MKITRRKLRSKFRDLATFVIRSAQKSLIFDCACGYLTIFHDYEGSYALQGKKESSYYGITRLLEIEKRHNIKATYNIVGRLFEDHPEIINRIIEEGHDIASHSYGHEVMTKLSPKQIDEDIKKVKEIFSKFNIELNGVRSPQSRWSFALIKSMLANGLKWSAENDKSDFPYIINRRGNNSIVRFPIKMDDWEYISKYVSPEEMYEKLMKKVNEIKTKKCFGAIGFHPWVQGEDKNRLKMFDEFIRTIDNTPDIKIVTFNEAYHNYVRTNKNQ